MKTKAVLATVLIVLFLGVPTHMVEAQKKTTPKTMEGTISKFECGDNCYLTITDAKQKEHTGLCLAPLCTAWTEQQKMPRTFKGKRVRVVIGKGKQYDDEGHVMGTMDAFTKIEILK
jgi:hypothetical protein